MRTLGVSSASRLRLAQDSHMVSDDFDDLPYDDEPGGYQGIYQGSATVYCYTFSYCSATEADRRNLKSNLKCDSDIRYPCHVFVNLKNVTRISDIAVTFFV